jgi:Zn ribbon nucleic-acid-binding protein
MDFYNNKKITRRKFVKGVAGAAVCCACSSLDCLAASEENSELEIEDVEDGKGKVHLAAACGTFCGACPAYIAKHSEDEKRFSSGPMKPNIDGFVAYMNNQRCDGCLSGGMLAGHCQTCKIRLCAANKQNDSRCSDCEELPCSDITSLINQGGYPHRQEYLPNLEKIRQMGVQEWVKYEEERWRCPQCGLPMSWYDAKCAGCGEPRSEDLFPLSKNKIQSF